MAKGRTYPRARARGRTLYIECAKTGETLSQIAERADVARSTIYAIANGTECALDTAARVARAVGQPLEEIFELVERPS